MYELYPYFTNDGSVGLFSQADDDIYHSTYGALTESWQKFIIPAHLEEYLSGHESVKILDICYGIGYNTKTALNVFIKNFMKTKNKLAKEKKFKNKFSNKHVHPSIAAIDTDNIAKRGIERKNKNYSDFDEKSTEPSTICNATIDVDNIQEAFEHNIELLDELNNDLNESAKNEFCENENIKCKNILIDAVDLDKVLIEISPFIVELSRFNNIFYKKHNLDSVGGKIKCKQIIKIGNRKIKLKNEYRLKKEVGMIILLKLFERNKDFFDDKILQSIFSQNKYSPFLSKYMLNFARFLQNQGYNYNKKQNKSSFLHNIYYEYISKSYKNAKFLLENSKICVNFINDDARKFLKRTSSKYHFIFLDAFTPTKCPALWSIQFFNTLYSMLEDDGMLLTYSNSAAVRNALLLSGFYVGKTYDADLNKFIGTVAAKNKNLIDYPLNEIDIELINSKAGIVFEDENLELDNQTIIKNRTAKVENSELASSSKILKGRKGENIKSL